MKINNRGLDVLTTPEEKAEIEAVGVKPLPVLKREQPQKDYKLVNDEPVHVGWLDMYTIVNDWKDSLGRNRKGSTFGLLGLQELGIDSTQCRII